MNRRGKNLNAVRSRAHNNNDTNSLVERQRPARDRAEAGADAVHHGATPRHTLFARNSLQSRAGMSSTGQMRIPVHVHKSMHVQERILRDRNSFQNRGIVRHYSLPRRATIRRRRTRPGRGLWRVLCRQLLRAQCGHLPTHGPCSRLGPRLCRARVRYLQTTGARGGPERRP